MLNPTGTTRPISSRLMGTVAQALLITACCLQDAKASSPELAYVEFYDPDESSLVELSAPVIWGSGHDQKRSLWRLRIDWGIVDPASDWIPTQAGTYTNRLKTGALAGLRIEHMLTPQFGIEYGVSGTRRLSASASASDSTQFGSASLSGFSPYFLGLNLHISPERALDFYIGIQIANADHGNLRLTVQEDGNTTNIPIDSDIGWGASAGVDIPLGRRGWVAHLGVRFMRFKFRYVTAPIHAQSFKTYSMYAGFGYRF